MYIYTRVHMPTNLNTQGQSHICMYIYTALHFVYPFHCESGCSDVNFSFKLKKYSGLQVTQGKCFD